MDRNLIKNDEIKERKKKKKKNFIVALKFWLRYYQYYWKNIDKINLTILKKVINSD